jgi:hypothetical protein
MFTNFQNPAFRGSNFKWEKFPEIVSNLARAQVFTTIYVTPTNKQEVSDMAGKVAKEIAEKYVYDIETKDN